MEWLNQFPIVAQIILCVMALNVFLTGLKTALDYIKDMTRSQIDNKMADALGKVLGTMSKVIDYISANKSHTKK